MTRIKNWLQRQRRHKKFIKMATGFRLGRWNVYKQVRLALVKQGQHSYIDRKRKKRDFRRLWIERITAAVEARGFKYSKFIHAASQKDIIVNRKVLSNLALIFPTVFDEIYANVVK